MASVTQRIKEINQPRNGYLPISMFECIDLDQERKTCIEDENIHPSMIGLTVDYLTRYIVTGDVRKAFFISLEGAKRANKQEHAKMLLNRIKDLSDDSVRAACKLVHYDVFRRSFFAAHQYFNEKITEADDRTVCNIRKMVESSINVFEKYGQPTSIGVTFEGAYTEVVDSGDADFLADDTLWDFKVTKRERPDSKDTLQLLIYYVMGLHSTHHNEFSKVKYLAIYNPRLNRLYRCPIDKIPQETIKAVEQKIICYESNSDDVWAYERKELMEKLKSGESLNIRQLCTLLDTSPRCVDILINAGWLSVVKSGKKRMFPAREVMQWCDEGRKNYTLEDWYKEGEKRFGNDVSQWKFRCPHCGKTYTVSEYRKVKMDEFPFMMAGKKCIDWYVNQKKRDDRNCLYQYFYANKVEMAKGGVIIEKDGERVRLFDFAD